MPCGFAGLGGSVGEASEPPASRRPCAQPLRGKVKSMIRTARRTLFFFLVLACINVSSGQDVLITEFMARRTDSIRDDDGDRAEFIELYTGGATAVDIGGYFLSDHCVNRFQWSFPEGVTIGPAEFLVVWATEKDRRDPCCDLHTNFRLEGEGECLVLSDASGEQVDIYQFFPEQVLGYSYGVPMSGQQFPLVSASSPCTATVPGPDNSVEGFEWTQPDYDDSAWMTGTTGVGFDLDPDYLPFLGLDVGEIMLGNNATCYVRIPFQVDDPAEILRMEFTMKFDDGFIVYINGTRVASKHAPQNPTSESRATRFQIDSRALDFQEIALDEGAAVLRAGQNIFAIHGLNETKTSKDLLLLPRLIGLARGGLERQVRNFFPTPTPGEPNAPGAPGVSATPVLSHPSGAYPSASLSVMASMEVPVEGTVIRYTLDGETPDHGSALLGGPIAVDSEIVLTARAFQPGLVPSVPVAGHYVGLGEDVLDFSSPIPVLVCSTLGKQVPRVCSSGPYIPGRFLLFTPGDDGRAHLTDDPHFAHRVGYRRRGNPNVGCLREKMYFNIEFRDRENRDEDVQFLHFAPHSDFAMFPPWNIDRGYMRNPIAYWMSREIGRWAPQTQFVECFLHKAGQQELSMESYWGVYVLIERIERGPGRVELDRLGSGSEDDEEPNITGGYLLQRDRVKTNDVAIRAGGFGAIVFAEPQPPTAAQKSYIKGYIDTAINSLNPNIGRQGDSGLIDVGSFIDYHILNFFPKEVDAFIFSAYMYKTRNGPLVMGPIWDYDRSMGAADDGRVADPLGWDAGGTRMFESTYSWYGRLFDNQKPLGPSPWARAYRERWREVRAGPLSTEKIHAQIDEWTALLEEPAERNTARWPGVRPRFGSYQSEINHLKSWLKTRAEWIDEQFEGLDVDRPTIRPASGLIEPGTQVVISVERGDIFYTLNGKDPILPLSQRIAYSGPITITTNTKIRARTRRERGWSDLAEAGFITEETSLVVSEIMYNPRALEGDTFGKSFYEFIELHNPGDSLTSLGGVILGSPSFEFPLEGDVTTLGPREYIVLVRDVEAFTERYGTEGVLIGGEFDGILSNAAQEVVLTDMAGTILMDFSYHSSWHRSTNGEGRSLVIESPTAPPESWNDPAKWRASLENEGSPGREDTELENLRLQGDLDGNGFLDITDVVRILINLFGQPTEPCHTEEGNRELQDTDGDGVLTQNDALRLLKYFFLGESPPVGGLECIPIPGCPGGCG